MARGVKITIENSVLIWAREAIGYSLEKAAAKAEIGQKVLENWEKAPCEISLADIKKVAKAYKRPISFFFLPSPPNEQPVPSDFRTLDSARVDAMPQKVRLAIRRAQANRKTIRDFFPEEYPLKISKDISLTDGAASTAQKFREFFDFSIEQQFALKDEKEALAHWIGLVEGKGIAVFQMDLNRDKKTDGETDLPDGDYRGFCLREDNLPRVIVINSKDSRAGRIFTLIHELCHLFIKQTQIDNLRASRGEARAHMIVEAFANEFAGSFLVPEASFRIQDYFKQYKQSKNDALVVKLSKKFKVSELVILRRFEVLGILTKTEYDEKKKIIDAKYEQLKIIQREKLRKYLEEHPDSFISKDIPKATIQKVGYSLGANAFRAVTDGRMTTFDLAQFLDVKVKHLDTIKGLIEKKYPSIA